MRACGTDSSVPLAESVGHAAKHALAALWRGWWGISGGCKAGLALME